MKKHILPLLMIITSFIMWAFFYNKLPAELPTHWNASGEADGFSSKLTTFFMSNGMMVLMYVMFLILPKIDPKKINYKYFSKGYSSIVIGIMILFFAINLGTIYIGLGHELKMERLIVILIGVLFLFVGNYMQQVKSNYFMGIRTPWTLSNETVWNKTHRVGSKVFMIAGILIMVTVFLPPSMMIWAIITIAFLMSAIPIVYSYVLYKKITTE